MAKLDKNKLKIVRYGKIINQYKAEDKWITTIKYKNKEHYFTHKNRDAIRNLKKKLNKR